MTFPMTTFKPLKLGKPENARGNFQNTQLLNSISLVSPASTHCVIYQQE